MKSIPAVSLEARGRGGGGGYVICILYLSAGFGAVSARIMIFLRCRTLSGSQKMFSNDFFFQANNMLVRWLEDANWSWINAYNIHVEAAISGNTFISGEGNWNDQQDTCRCFNDY